MDDVRVRAKIFRFDPATGDSARYQQFEVSASSTMRVLDVLRSVYEHQAGDLAFQYACRVGRCGTCGVRVNGRPVLACQERVKPEMTIEPLTPFPVVRDLVIDYREMQTRYSDYSLAPIGADQHPGRRSAMALTQTRKIGLMGSCVACMICVSACPAVAERPFDGPAFMLQLRRLAEHPADHGARLKQAIEGGLLECFGCDVCTQVCPADLSPADAIRDFRRDLLLGSKKKGFMTCEGAS